MRFTTLLLTLATTALAAAAADNQPAGRDAFRASLKRSAQWDNKNPWGGHGGGSVWASGTCDADNDCPRLCRHDYGDQFSDEGTKCCFNKCACAGGCEGNGGKNECDADNDCPRVCRDSYGIDVDSKHSKCCSGGCNCYGTSCGGGWGGWN